MLILKYNFKIHIVVLYYALADSTGTTELHHELHTIRDYHVNVNILINTYVREIIYRIQNCGNLFMHVSDGFREFNLFLFRFIIHFLLNNVITMSLHVLGVH